MNYRRPTRRRVLAVAVIGLAMVASFFAGQFWEYLFHGRWLTVLDSRTFDSALGTFELRHVSDTIGIPLLVPGSSILSFQSPMGEVILYRSDRIFQESFPWVNSIHLNGHDARWSDGQYQYLLHIEPIVPTTPATQPATTQAVAPRPADR